MEGDGSVLPPTPVGGCSETVKTAEGDTEDPVPKSKKGAEDEDQNDNSEAGGRGSEIPLVREQQLHPLQNPVILTHLFERCPPKLLAKFRLVSKQWRDISLTSWRDTAPLTVDYPRGQPTDRPTFEEYVEFMNNPENKCGVKPHRRMKLVSWNNDLNKEAIQSFWNRVGRDLTCLELYDCDFPEVDDLRRNIFRFCPNLKRLCLDRCTFFKSDLVPDFRKLKYKEPPTGEQTNLRALSVEIAAKADRDVHRLPIHWLELLSHFPSLTSLKASLNRIYPRRTESVHEELLSAIGIIKMRDAKKLCIRNFELSPPLKYLEDIDPHPDLALFEELQLPLQFLEIELRSSLNPGNDALEEFLNRHRNTLLEITVRPDQTQGYSFSRYPYSWWFPCNVMLEKLEEFHSHMLFSSMEFLKNTPKLQKLEFLKASIYRQGKQEETRIFLEPDVSTLVGVKLLHLTEFRMDYRVACEDIAIFAGLMPNVTKLTMSLSDKLFSTVCQSWGKLKELEVVGEDLTDKGVTGLSREGRKIAPAAVTNLHSLEVFKFWSQELTDLSVFRGFLKLPSLKLVEVCEGVMPLRKPARKALRDKHITFRGKYEYEP